MSPIPPYTPSGGGGATTLTGAGAPNVLDGVDGDTYIDTDDDAIYLKVAGAWVEKLNTSSAVFESFQSAAYAGGGGIWAANEIVDGDQWVSKGISPAGTGSWQNGVNNPSAALPALLHVAVKATPILLTPPSDGTLYRVRRVGILTFDGQTDVSVYTDDGTYDASKGGIYVPQLDLMINRAVAAGFSGAAVITDELQVDWSGPAPITAYPQNPRSWGTVTGRVG